MKSSLFTQYMLVFLTYKLRVCCCFFIQKCKVIGYPISFGQEKQVVIWKKKKKYIWSIPNNCETMQGLFPKTIIITSESLPLLISHVYLIYLFIYLFKLRLEACRMPDVFHSCCSAAKKSIFHLKAEVCKIVVGTLPTANKVDLDFLSSFNCWTSLKLIKVILKYVISSQCKDYRQSGTSRGNSCTYSAGCITRK